MFLLFNFFASLSITSFFAVKHGFTGGGVVGDGGHLLQPLSCLLFHALTTCPYMVQVGGSALNIIDKRLVLVRGQTGCYNYSLLPLELRDRTMQG